MSMMASFLPVMEISAYGRKDWVIKASVTSKNPIRTFKRNNGDGKILNVNLIDGEGTEIRATFWNDSAVEHEAKLQKGKVYTFSGGQVKLANKKYTTIPHNYEIHFDEKAKVDELAEAMEIKQAKFENIKPLRALANMQPPALVNILGVVQKLGEKRDIKTKATQRDATLRKLVLVDASECSIEVTLWAEPANLPDSRLQPGTVIGIKEMRLGEYGGRSGSAGDLDNLLFDLDTPEFVTLRNWWNSTGSTAPVRALSTENLKPGATVITGTLEDLETAAEKLQQDQTLYFNTKAYMVYLKTKGQNGPLTLWYEACPNCNKKCLEGVCAKCNKTVTPNMRYVIPSMLIEDGGSQKWVGAFDDAAVLLLGMKADKLKADGGENPDVVDKKMKNEYFRKEYSMRLRVSMDSYEGQARVRTQIMQVSEINYDADAQELLAQTKELFAGASPSAQLEVKDLLSSWPELQQEEKVAKSWQTGYDNLVQLVAAC